MISRSDFGVGGRGEGNEGGKGGGKPTDSELETSDFEGEEEYEEDEQTTDPNLEWMTQGPLALPNVLHNMPKRAERMNVKFDLNNIVKAEDHLDNFYLQL